MSVFKVVLSLSLIVLTGVTVLYGLSYKGSKSWIKLFFIYLVIMLFSDLIGKWMWLNGQNNLLVSQVFNYIELLLITVFYLNFALDKKTSFILPSAIGVGLIMIGTTLFVYDFQEFNVIGFFSFKFFVILFSLRELYLHKMEDHSRCYWINMGLLITSAVNVATLSFVNILTGYSNEAQTSVWIFNALIYIVALSFYGVEILKENKWKLTS